MNNPNLIPIYAEIFLVVATSAILLIDMFLSESKRGITYALSLLTLVGCAYFSFVDFSAGTTTYTFYNMVVSDPMGNLLKLFTYLTVGVTFVYARQYTTDRGMLGGSLGGEFYVLALFSMLGQMVMIAANNFLSIYLGLELMSLATYALVALRRDHTMSTEAAMKYFVLGALASGFLLYGMSMLYGATGTLDLSAMAAKIASGTVAPTILVFGLVFVVSGLAFKLGAVPFHMWVPDVYQGSPTGVTLLLGAAPKLATFAICIRLLVEGLLPLALDWQQMLMILAVLSLAIGNLTAIAQTNLKRMLAYSTIAQMGFVLLGLMAGVTGQDQSNASAAYSAAMYYSITYVLTTLGTFGLIMVLARAGHEAEELADFKGLSKRSPWFALVMTLLMFSLAGVPPMMGFAAKLAVLQTVLHTGQVWLTIFAVMASLIAAFYYLRVVKTMWFDEPVDTARISVAADKNIVLGFNALLVVALGIVPGPLLDACLHAMTKTLAS
ncbi:NADH-quinone oxidoreductase subunit NuoN [Pseudoduganella chitinolytica]|uniref:NADH-quinone oxidoreductase subunit N n=1 Tax=Pseudoduganella chitinolytica TaxID=34070 RepID=A0ABY8BG00_9BURK|nr:NADH-quinone oxidoreductase subunit NuoN [Pseudoduganella chitinolytica]WEF33652.1 NADH-quinone oxidoreductase subunit NuoN [Pseudoduganella chitinolytica]